MDKVQMGIECVFNPVEGKFVARIEIPELNIDDECRYDLTTFPAEIERIRREIAAIWLTSPSLPVSVADEVVSVFEGAWSEYQASLS